MANSEKRYDMFVISLLIVFFSVLWFVGSVNLVRQMQKNNQLTGFAISDNKNNTINQTQPQEVYSVKSYTIFYLSVIFLLIIVAVISLILIAPRLKKYT